MGEQLAIGAETFTVVLTKIADGSQTFQEFAGRAGALAFADRLNAREIPFFAEVYEGKAGKLGQLIFTL